MKAEETWVQMSIFDFLSQDSWCGKMSKEPSQATTEKISDASLKKPQKLSKGMPLFLDLRTENGHIPDVSWEMGGQLLGDYMMHSFGEFPKEEKESRLSQILQGGALRKYYLSEKACQGILNRAERRGKELPKMLKDALIQQASLSKLGGGVDTDSNGRKAGKGALIQTELSGTLGVSQDQTLVCFEPGVASRVGGHIYEDDKSATIRANAGDNALAVAYKKKGHPQNSEQPQEWKKAEINDTLSTSDNTDARTPTLIIDKPIAYGISSYDSNAMKSSNPHSGIYEADTSRTLDLNGGNPGCNQGGIAVVQGADLYNGKLSGDVAVTLTANTNSTSAGPTLCIDQGAGKSQCGITENVSPTLATTHGGEPVVYDASRRHDYEPFGDICETVQAHYGTGGGNIPMVVDKSQPISCEVFHCETEEDKVKTLKARDYKDPQIVAYGVDAYNQTQSEEKTKALNSSATDSDHIPLVYGLDRASFNQGINAKYEFQVDEEKTQTLVAKGPNAICARDSKGIGNQYVDEGKCIVESYQDSVGSLCARDSKGIDSVVRRLTPMECERLQGFPDGWTDIGDWIDSKGKKHKGDSDSPRYKALGNSIALPFWQWMAERMVDMLHTDGTEEPTMASLFDGIGGFPLVYSRCGCKPIWASEIEEFPIAVTKIRFPSN